MTTRVEVAIIGAGPAGCAAAIELARAGMRPWVIERFCFPRAKVCGGCLSVSAVNLLADLLGSEHTALGTPTRRISFVIGKQRLDCRPDGQARMIRRSELDYRLANRASELGARFAFGQPAHLQRSARGFGVRVGSQTLQAHHIFAAGGLGSLPRELGIKATASRLHLVGQQWQQPRSGCLPDTGIVELHWLRGGYVGLATPLRDHCVIALAAERGRLQGRSPLQTLQHMNPDSDLWDGLSPQAPLNYGGRGTAGFPFRPHALGSANVLLVGDAAGYAEPFTGEGIAQALLSGRLAAQAVLSGEPVLECYDDLIAKQHRPVMKRTARIGWLLRTPIIRWIVSQPLSMLGNALSGMIRRVHLEEYA